MRGAAGADAKGAGEDASECDGCTWYMWLSVAMHLLVTALTMDASLRWYLTRADT